MATKPRRDQVIATAAAFAGPSSTQTAAAQLRLSPAQQAVLEGMAPTRVSLTNLQDMLSRSVPVRLAHNFIAGNSARRLGEYTNPNPGVEEDVRTNLLPTLLKVAPKLLLANYLGVALAEPRYEVVADGLRLTRVKVAEPSLFWTGKPVRDEADRLVQWTRQGAATIEFFTPQGMRQVVHVAFGSDTDNAWGDGWGQRAYPSYLTLKNLVIFEGVASEVASVPHKVLPYLDVPETKLSETVAAVAALGANSVVALDKEHYPDGIVPVEVSPDAGLYDQAIRRHVTWAFWAAGVPPLLLAEAEFGTRAQASVQMDAYLGTETQLAETLADEVLRDQIIAPYVWARFGPTAEPGEIAIRPAVPPDPTQWVSIIAQLTAGGWLNPDNPEHRQQVGDLFEFELGDEAIAGLPNERRQEQRASAADEEALPVDEEVA